MLHRVRIVKLLTQHVVRGDFWVPTNGSPPCWWWSFQSAVCIHDWFQMGCHFSPSLIQLDCCSRHSSIPRKRRGKPTTTTTTTRSSVCTLQSTLTGGGPNSHTMQAGSSVDDATPSRAEVTTSPEHFAASSLTLYVSPSDVYSILKARLRKSKSSARKGKTQIQTSIPVRVK